MNTVRNIFTNLQTAFLKALITQKIQLNFAQTPAKRKDVTSIKIKRIPRVELRVSTDGRTDGPTDKNPSVDV